MRKVIYSLCLGLPLLVGGLYAYSGGGGLTARERRREIVEKDELFGEQVRVELAPGPVLGWYVGWDAVAAAGVAGLMGCTGVWLIGRRSKGSAR